MSNFRAIRWLKHPVWRLRDFMRSWGKTSFCLVNRCPERHLGCHHLRWRRRKWCLGCVVVFVVAFVLFCFIQASQKGAGLIHMINLTVIYREAAVLLIYKRWKAWAALQDKLHNPCDMLQSHCTLHWESLSHYFENGVYVFPDWYKSICNFNTLPSNL